MYVERIPNRNSPPAILLRESYRQGDKFKRRTLANLSDWPAAKIEALRRVLRDEAVVPADQQALRLVRSLPHGHVAAALGMLRKLGLDRILSQGGRQPRREVALCIAMIVARLIDPPPSWRRRVDSMARRRPARWARCLSLAPSTSRNSTKRSTGYEENSGASSRRWRGVTCATGCWFSMM
jgi:hypothetical protein